MAITPTLASLDARLTVVESALKILPPPVPVVNPESPAKTSITKAGQAIYASATPGIPGSANKLEISTTGTILLNGKLLGGAAVIEIYYNDKHTAYQNGGGSWWGPITASGTGSSVANPKGVVVMPPPPPPPSNVPAPAASSGYNMLTYGPKLTLGSNLFPMSFGNGNHSLNKAWQNADGSVTFAGGENGWNGHFMNITPAGNADGFSGMAFGGGAYFEATLSWANAFNAGSGWPAYWSVNVDNAVHGTEPHIETDFMEFFGQSNPACTLLDWWTPGTFARQAVDSHSTNGNQVHKYGTLWIPATSQSQGSIEAFIDGVSLGKMTWNKYVAGRGLPPNQGDQSFSPMDIYKHILIFGTSVDNPMTIFDCVVWQKDTLANLTH